MAEDRSEHSEDGAISFVERFGQEKQRYVVETVRAKEFVAQERKNYWYYQLGRNFSETQEASCRDQIRDALAGTDVATNYDEIGFSFLPDDPLDSKTPAGKVLKYHRGLVTKLKHFSNVPAHEQSGLISAETSYVPLDNTVLVGLRCLTVTSQEKGLYSWFNYIGSHQQPVFPQDWWTFYHEGTHAITDPSPKVARLSLDEFKEAVSGNKVNRKYAEAIGEIRLDNQATTEYGASGFEQAFSEVVADLGPGDLGMLEDIVGSDGMIKHEATSVGHAKHYNIDPKDWESMITSFSDTFYRMRGLGVSVPGICKLVRGGMFVDNKYVEIWDKEQSKSEWLEAEVGKLEVMKHGRELSENERLAQVETEKEKVTWRTAKLKEAIFRGYNAEIDTAIVSGRPLLLREEYIREEKAHFVVINNGNEFRDEPNAIMEIDFVWEKGKPVYLSVSKRKLRENAEEVNSQSLSADFSSDAKFADVVNQAEPAVLANRFVQALGEDQILQLDLDLSEEDWYQERLGKTETVNADVDTINDLSREVLLAISKRAGELKESYL